MRDLESSSKKALARELRRAEEQARADLAAAAEAHDAESAALRAKVAALERETAKAAVNLRQVSAEKLSGSGLVFLSDVVQGMQASKLPTRLSSELWSAISSRPMPEA